MAYRPPNERLEMTYLDSLPANVTARTHTIRARYEITPGVDGIEVDTNGYTLVEIVLDLLEFFNAAEETAVSFTLDTINDIYDDQSDFTVTLKGEFFATTHNGEYDKNSRESVNVIIEAIEK